MGNTFSNIPNIVKIQTENEIMDDYTLMGPQAVGSGGMGFGSYGSIGSLIQSGMCRRENENTIIFYPLYGGNNRFYYHIQGQNAYLLLDKNNTPINCTNTAKVVNATGKKEDIMFENNSSNVTFNYEQGKFIYDPKINTKIGSYIIELLSDNIDANNTLVVFCQNGAIVGEPTLLAQGFNDGFFYGLDANKFKILDSLFEHYEIYVGSIDNVILATLDESSQSIIVMPTKNYITSKGEVFSSYYFNSNGKHTIDFDFMDFFVDGISESTIDHFDGSCSTYFSPEAFDGVNRILLSKCTNIQELTIPKSCYNVKLRNVKKLKLNPLNRTYKIIDNFYLVYVNSLVTLFGTPVSITLPKCITHIYEDAIQLDSINHINFNNVKVNLSLDLSNSPNLTGISIFNLDQLTRIISPYLTECIVNGNINMVSQGAFMDCPLVQLKGTYVTNDAKCIFNHSNKLLYYKNDGETEYSIQDGITEIAKTAFQGCDLASITLPNSVIKINEYSFYGCENLTNFIMPNSVKEIGGQIFCNCKSLTSITLSESITEIPYSAFSGCISLKEIVIPSSITSIDNYVFNSCTSLTKITSHVRSYTNIAKSKTFYGIASNGVLYYPSSNNYMYTAYWLSKTGYNLGYYNWTGVTI